MSESYTPLLEASGISKTYRHRAVLQDVHLSVNREERVAIMGPSGSGKSTLLNCLAGIDRPDSGSIVLDGESVTDRSPAAVAELRRTLVSTIFQFFHLLPTLTAFENIELPLQLIGMAQAERERQVRELIEAVGLQHRQHALPGELSGGEMQRVAIARALVHQPRLVLADEPTGNLDSQTGETILNLLEELTARTSMSLLLVTHSERATRICNRVLHMVDGQLKEVVPS